MSRGNQKTHQRKNSAEDNMIRMIDDGRREYNPSSLRVRKVKASELPGRVPDFAPPPKDDAERFDEKKYKESRRIKKIFLRHKKDGWED